MPTLTAAQTDYLRDVNTPWKMRLAFFLRKLPTLFWWGVRVKSATEDRAEVTIPYTWRTQNPFKSVYFAAQAGAA
ncbi:MAG: hypothetical protein WBA17_00375, partial [Saprospiraceae bacterium]